MRRQCLQFSPRPHGRRDLRAGRARLRDHLQRQPRHQLRAGRVRDDRRHERGVAASTPGLPLPLAHRRRRRRLACWSGLLLEKLAVEPARGAPVVTLIIITIGASILLRGSRSSCGTRSIHRAAAVLRRSRRSRSCGATLLPQSLWVLGGDGRRRGGAVRGSSAARSRQGDARDVAQPARGAARRASDVRRVLLASFGLSAALGALAGMLIAPITFTSYDVGIMLGPEGLRRGDARRPGQLPGRGRRRPRARPARGARRRLRLLRLQGCHRFRRSSSQCSFFLPERPRSARGDSRARLGKAASPLPRPAHVAVVLAPHRLLPLRSQQLHLRGGDPRRAERDRVRRAEPADRLRRPDQPRPCRLLRPRRLWLGDSRRALRLAAGAFAAGRGRRRRRPRWLVGRPILRLKGHYLAMATLGLGIIVSHRARHRGPDHRRARWHGRAAADLFGIRCQWRAPWYWIVGGGPASLPSGWR